MSYSPEAQAILDLLQDRVVAFHPVLARITGSATAALFLTQLLFWNGKGRDPQGWIYKTVQEWTEDTGLSRDEQQTARKRLRGLGLLEEQRRGIPYRNYYRLDLKRLVDLVSDPAIGRQSRRMADRNAVGHWTAIPSAITEMTAEITPEITSEKTGSKTEEKAHGSAASQPQPMLDSVFVHQEHHAAADVEAPLRDGGRDRPRAAEGGGVSPREGPHQVQQQTDHLVERFRAHLSGLEFLRGEGTLREIFQGVKDWKLTWKQVYALGAAIDNADPATDWFENGGEDIGKRRCSPWEWCEERLLESMAALPTEET